MRVYSVHLRRHGLDLDRDISVVKEGFSWPALCFGAFWALWHRHWLVAGVLLAVPAAISGLSNLFGANPATPVVLSVAWSVWVGLTANDLRRHLLERAGFIEAGLAAGRDPDEALLSYLRDDTSAMIPTEPAEKAAAT